ncbi:MAG: peptidoglycan endopeptidase [Verrucomicrobia bacterium]|nr:peptidoglycan endopeptidase [Verrucomicrobiota bacterium]
MSLPRAVSSVVPVLAALILAGCQSTPPYVYHYVPGRTAVLENGIAVAPPLAPPAVQLAIAAGNEIAGKPYRFGGGHRSFYDDGYDCSGAVSYVLHAAGWLAAPGPSWSFRKYGESGAGHWITVYAHSGHVFLVVAGLRFDTGYGSVTGGPAWLTRSRPADRYVLRHPPGL